MLEVNSWRITLSHTPLVSISLSLSVSLHVQLLETHWWIFFWHCHDALLDLGKSCSLHVDSFGIWLLATSHPSLPLPEGPLSMHDSYWWLKCLQILCCAPRNPSWYWVGPIDGCLHRICYGGPHAGHSEQLFFSVKESNSPLALLKWICGRF